MFSLILVSLGLFLVRAEAATFVSSESSTFESGSGTEFRVAYPGIDGEASGELVADEISFGDLKAEAEFGAIRKRTLGINADGVVGFGLGSEPSPSVLRKFANPRVGLMVTNVGGKVYVGETPASAGTLTPFNSVPNAQGEYDEWALPVVRVVLGDTTLFTTDNLTSDGQLRAVLRTGERCMGLPSPLYERFAYAHGQQTDPLFQIVLGAGGATTINIPASAYESNSLFCFTNTATDISLGLAFIRLSYLELAITSPPQISLGTAFVPDIQQQPAVPENDKRRVAENLVAISNTRFSTKVSLGSSSQEVQLMVDIQSSAMIVNTEAGTTVDTTPTIIVGVIGGSVAAVMLLVCIGTVLFYRFVVSHPE